MIWLRKGLVFYEKIETHIRNIDNSYMFPDIYFSKLHVLYIILWRSVNDVMAFFCFLGIVLLRNTNVNADDCKTYRNGCAGNTVCIDMYIACCDV